MNCHYFCNIQHNTWLCLILFSNIEEKKNSERIKYKKNHFNNFCISAFFKVPCMTLVCFKHNVGFVLSIHKNLIKYRTENIFLFVFQLLLYNIFFTFVFVFSITIISYISINLLSLFRFGWLIGQSNKLFGFLPGKEMYRVRPRF